MTGYVVALALCGIVAAPFLGWMFIALVGLALVPIYLMAMIAAGTPVLEALGQALLGYAALQVAFALSGFGLELVRGRRTPDDQTTKHTGPMRADAERIRIDRAGSTGLPDAARATAASESRVAGRGPRAAGVAAWPLFGGWLPLAAFYDPPCHADGSPWDGVSDPGYRTTILVFGWFNRAASVQVGSPRRRSTSGRREMGRAVEQIDERVQASRSRLDETGRG